MKSPKFGIVVYPGSNCDHDAYYAVKKQLGFDADFLWHKEKDLKNSDVIILPGGFSYGDYLRTGAVARFSPIMDKVFNFAETGGIVIGICNGFQILLESNLLPGCMIQNETLKFICRDVYLKVETKSSIFSSDIKKDILRIPVAHGEGNYYADENTLSELNANSQILFRYSSETGDTGKLFNPNGSLENIAGILNKRGNILGMMPHPERACDNSLRNTDGESIFYSVVKSFNY
ncbi:MAG: phosphoribosylformylglycinamidine synthase subunit PurQ [Ignavibacteriales bacterium]|nr:phosphoribosylformylglycinamidine synthase subunit PurQ [Ignavibacteriales bacterium]MCF8438147.1 phosphoribosylformylglycinamidine synthase subunit PurQ [Ignavibacteriales bacterium]